MTSLDRLDPATWPERASVHVGHRWSGDGDSIC